MRGWVSTQACVGGAVQRLLGRDGLASPFSDSCCCFLWTLCSTWPFPGTTANRPEPWTGSGLALGTEDRLGPRIPPPQDPCCLQPSLVRPPLLSSEMASLLSRCVLQLINKGLRADMGDGVAEGTCLGLDPWHVCRS